MLATVMSTTVPHTSMNTNIAEDIGSIIICVYLLNIIVIAIWLHISTCNLYREYSSPDP